MGSWCMSQHATLVYGWPPPHSPQELCPHFTGQKVHCCPVSFTGWSVGYLLVLNTPGVFIVSYMLVFQRKGEHRPYRNPCFEMGICYCDLQRGLLQEAFLRNNPGEHFPSNTGWGFIPPTSIPTPLTMYLLPNIRASLKLKIQIS